MNDLGATDTITGAGVTLVVKTGTDPNPASHLIGAFYVEGTQVIQRIRGLLPYNVYTLQIVAGTQLGNSISLFSHITCEPVD